MDEHWLNHKGDEYLKSMTGVNEMMLCREGHLIFHAEDL